MKPSIILAVTAVLAAMVAVYRHHHLSELRKETFRLERRSELPHSGPSRGEEEPVAHATEEQVELVRETLVEFLTFEDRQPGPGSVETEREKRFLLAARILSARNIATVFEQLRSDPRLAGVQGDKIIGACHALLHGVAPFAWREYLAAHPDLPYWQAMFDRTTQACLREDGKRALAMIEKETTRGDHAAATTAIRSGVLLELAATDPDRMLEKAASPEYATDPEALLHLGGSVDDRFESLADHRRFLEALRRAQEKNPSPLLVTIREDYTREMAGVFIGWPAADAIALTDSQFTPDERFAVVERCSSVIDLVDKEQWLDWFMKIDAAEWEAWAKRKGNDTKHPLVRQIESQARNNSQLPRRWLEKIPPGILRAESVLAFAQMIADRDPELAESYLHELPETKGKKNLVRKIREAGK